MRSYLHSSIIYLSCAQNNYGDQLFQMICLAMEDVNTRNDRSFAFDFRSSSLYTRVGYSAGNRAVSLSIVYFNSSNHDTLHAPHSSLLN